MSQEVAILMSRDSAAMKVITAVMIFFLPATFTAVHSMSCCGYDVADGTQTFFSTTFFDFQVERSEHVYSRWLWLYFLVTILLTVLVLGGTWVLWRSKEVEIARRFAKAQKETKTRTMHE